MMKKKILTSEYLQPGNFKFINIIKTMKKYDQNIFRLIPRSNNYRMIINIIIDDDSLKSSNDLLKIIKLIESSLNSLNQVKVTINRFLICIFFQHLTYESSFKYLFPGLKFYNFIIANSYNFYCSLGKFNSKNKINLLLLYKEASTFVLIYKFFYSKLLPSLINFYPEQKNRTVLVVNWPNGKIFSNKNEKNKNISEQKMDSIPIPQTKKFLKNVLKICGNQNIILIPDIKFVPHKEDKTFGFMNQFNLENDKIKINLHWYIICGYPIDHRFFFINMNYELFYLLSEFYQKEAKDFCNEYYHDYHLVIYLKQNMKTIEIQKLIDIKVEYSDLPWNLMYYFHDLMLRRGSENANFFNLLHYFALCKNFDCIILFKKIFLFLKLLNDFIQFFWLGITFLIAYAVFNDTFGSKGNKMDYFCSLGYVITIIILLAISLLYIRNNPNIKSNKINRITELKQDYYNINLILYLVFYLYFFFFIICSIIALIHVKQGKYADINDSEYYVLNTDFLIILLFSNIFIYFFPFFLRFSSIISKGFLYYFFFYLPCATTFFHYPGLFTCMKTKNSKKNKEEALYTIFFVTLNGIVSVICLVFDTTREKRMHFLTIMGFIISILNFIQLITSIIGTCLINRFKKNYSKKINTDNNNIEINDDFCFKENNSNNIQNTQDVVLTDFNFINKDNDNNINNKENINKEKNTEIKKESYLDNSNNNNFQFFESMNKELLKNEKIILKNNSSFKGFNIDNNDKKISKSSYLENINENMEHFPMDSIENNVEIKSDKREIKKTPKKTLINSNNYFLNNKDTFPHDNTQSFSLKDSSSNHNPSILNEKDLAENLLLQFLHIFLEV